MAYHGSCGSLRPLCSWLRYGGISTMKRIVRFKWRFCSAHHRVLLFRVGRGYVTCVGLFRVEANEGASV